MALKSQNLKDMFAFKTREMSQKVKSQILAVTGRAGQSASRDYISALALIAEYEKVHGEGSAMKVQDSSELWAGVSDAVKFRLRSYTPCLAARYDGIKEDEQRRLFDDSNWVFTEKMNGVRGWLIVKDGKVNLFSRNYSDVDCGLLEYWNNIYQDTSWNEGIYAIDVELKFEPGVSISHLLDELGLETDSPLEAMVALLHTYPESAQEIQRKFKERFNKDLVAFYLIAPLYFNGKNYLKRTLGEGQDVYDECVKFGQSIGLNVKEIQRCAGTREEKEIFLDSLINAGREGVVAHNRHGIYCTSENRSKTSFIKIKRSVKTTSGLGDTIDGFVSGFVMGKTGTANEGIIGALEFSIWVNDNGHLYKKQIASVAGIERETRKLATWNNADGLYPQEWVDSDGVSHWVSLNPEFDELVAELSGQALSSKSQRLEHATMLMWRTERSSDSCIYTKEFLLANTTNVGIKY